VARRPETPEKTEKPESSQDGKDDAIDAVIEETETVDDESSEPDVSEGEEGRTSDDEPVILDAEIVDETVEATTAETNDPFPALAAPVKEAEKSSALPMVFGGILAGGIGFLVATFSGIGGPSGPDEGAVGNIQANSDQLAVLLDRVQKVESVDPVDLSGVEAQLSDLETRTAALSVGIEELNSVFSAELTGIGEQLTALDERLRRLENQPERGDGSAARAAAAEDELKAFRAELDAVIAEADAKVQAAQARAAEVEATTAEAKAAAEALAAKAELIAAIEGGSGYSELLENFPDAPDALKVSAKDGVPTMVSLQQSFPDAARAALASVQTVPQDASAGERLSAFLKRQTNARSLTPREGNDPDAILSRVESALNQGDLASALAEVSALPDAANAAMAGWLAKAHSRATALQAVDEFFAVTN